MSAQELVGFLVKGLVDNPDSVSVNVVEGEAMRILELALHPEDVDLVMGDDGETLEHLKVVVSASSGKRKTIIELVEASDADVDAEE